MRYTQSEELRLELGRVVKMIVALGLSLADVRLAGSDLVCKQRQLQSDYFASKRQLEAGRVAAKSQRFGSKSRLVADEHVVACESVFQGACYALSKVNCEIKDRDALLEFCEKLVRIGSDYADISTRYIAYGALASLCSTKNLVGWDRVCELLNMPLLGDDRIWEELPVYCREKILAYCCGYVARQVQEGDIALTGGSWAQLELCARAMAAKLEFGDSSIGKKAAIARSISVEQPTPIASEASVENAEMVCVAWQMLTHKPLNVPLSSFWPSGDMTRLGAPEGKGILSTCGEWFTDQAFCALSRYLTAETKALLLGDGKPAKVKQPSSKLAKELAKAIKTAPAQAKAQYQVALDKEMARLKAAMPEIEVKAIKLNPPNIDGTLIQACKDNYLGKLILLGHKASDYLVKTTINSPTWDHQGNCLDDRDQQYHTYTYFSCDKKVDTILTVNTGYIQLLGKLGILADVVTWDLRHQNYICAIDKLGNILAVIAPCKVHSKDLPTLAQVAQAQREIAEYDNQQLAKTSLAKAA